MPSQRKTSAAARSGSLPGGLRLPSAGTSQVPTNSMPSNFGDGPPLMSSVPSPMSVGSSLHDPAIGADSVPRASGLPSHGAPLNQTYGMGNPSQPGLMGPPNMQAQQMHPGQMNVNMHQPYGHQSPMHYHQHPNQMMGVNNNMNGPHMEHHSMQSAPGSSAPMPNAPYGHSSQGYPMNPGPGVNGHYAPNPRMFGHNGALPGGAMRGIGNADGAMHGQMGPSNGIIAPNFATSVPNSSFPGSSGMTMGPPNASMGPMGSMVGPHVGGPGSNGGSQLNSMRPSNPASAAERIGSSSGGSNGPGQINNPTNLSAGSSSVKGFTEAPICGANTAAAQNGQMFGANTFNRSGSAGPPNQGTQYGKIYPPNQPMVFNPSNPHAPPVYPCGICHKEVHDTDEAILCESGCNFWFHRICTGLNPQAYTLLTSEVYAEWVCDNCLNFKHIPPVKLKS